MQDLRQKAEKALDLARRAGAQSARVRAAASSFCEAEYKDGQLDKAGASSRSGLEITLFVDGRFGVHSSNDLRPEALAGFISRAVELTRLLAPDPLRGLPEANRLAKPPGPKLGLADADLAESRPETWLELAGRLDGLARKARRDSDPRLVATQGGAHAEHSRVVLADSGGLVLSREETGAFFGCVAVYLDPDQSQKRRMGWWWEGSRDLAGALDQTRHEALAQEARKRALDQMGAAPGPSGIYPVVLENQAAGQLISRLLSALRGPALKQKRSYLLGGLGRRMASPLLTLTDDPLLPGGFGSRWFDGEGVRATPFRLVEKGVLRAYYLDTYHARALELRPTVSGQGNLTMVPSTKGGLRELAGQVEDGLLVTGFLGGNFNATTGDFSLGVKGSWLKGGEVSRAVEGMNLAGNLGELLNSLAAVGSDPYPYSSLLTPSLLFGRAALSGA